MTFHSDTTLVHSPFAAIYATEALMLAATGFEGYAGIIVPFRSADISKMVLVQDDGSGWVLTAVSPTTWEAFSSGSSAGVAGTQWNYSDSIVDADPGTGNLRLDNVDHSLVTFIYIADENVDGLDMSIFIEDLTAGSKMSIQQDDDPLRSLLYTLSGAPVDAATYYKIPVVFEVAGSDVLQDGQQCTVGFQIHASGFPFSVHTVDLTDPDADFATLADAIAGSGTSDTLMLGPGSFESNELDVGSRTLIGRGSAVTSIEYDAATSYLMMASQYVNFIDLYLGFDTTVASGSLIFTDPSAYFNMPVTLYRCVTSIYTATDAYIVAGTKQARLRIYGGLHYVYGSGDGYSVEHTSGECKMFDMPTVYGLVNDGSRFIRGIYSTDENVNTLVTHQALTSDVTVGMRSLNAPSPLPGSDGIGVSHDFEASDDGSVIRKIGRIIARFTDVATALVRSRLTFTLFLGTDEIEVGNIEVPGVVPTAPGIRGAGSVDFQTARSDASHVASGDYSSLHSGRDNAAPGDYSRARGYGAVAPLYGQFSAASGYFVNPGDAQKTEYFLRNTVSHTTAAYVSLFLDGASLTIDLPVDVAGIFYGHVTGSRVGALGVQGYKFEGTFRSISGVVILLTSGMSVVGQERLQYNASISGGSHLDVSVNDDDADGISMQWVAAVTLIVTSYA